MIWLRKSGSFFAATVLLVSICSFPLSAQQKQSGFTVEQVLSAPFPTQLISAAHASRVAWAFAQCGSENVWTAEGPDFKPQQLTHYSGDNGQPIYSLRLTPDGKQAIYARGTEIDDEGRSANPQSLPVQTKQQVWSVSTTGGEPTLLGDLGCDDEGCEDIEISPDGEWATWATRHQLWIASLQGPVGIAKQLTDIRGDVSSPRWSPDGTRLAATVGRGDHRFMAILDVHAGRLGGVHYIAPSTDRDLAPQWSPDGNALAFLREEGVEERMPLIPIQSEPWSLWVANTHTFDAAPIWKSGQSARDSLPPSAARQLLFAADNRLLFASEADGRNHLYSLDTAGGQASLLTPGDFDVETATLSADKHSVLLATNQDDIDRRHIWRASVVPGQKMQELTRGDTIEWSPVSTSDGKDVICLGSSATTPALVYKLRNGTRELLTKNALPADFPSNQLVTPRQVILHTQDGFATHAQLFTPAHPTDRRAALIFVHGGPMRQMMLGFHSMGYYSNAYAENQHLASLGFTVFSINYRLGTMYGHDFREPKNANWRGAAEYNDVLAGAHYLQSLPTIDPHRIGIWGGSYGGYLVALALARNSDIFAAGVDMHGVHDRTDSLKYEEKDATAAPDYAAAQKLAWESSPIADIDHWKSPVLLIQGDDDRNVPFSQMVTLVQKLRRENVPFESIVFPDEIHEFLLWHDWVRAYEATDAFFLKHLGNPAP